MSMFDCELLVQNYSTWIRDNTKVKVVGQTCILTSPFLDRHNDYLEILVERTTEGWLLSDDGYTLRDLGVSGLEITSERRTEILENLLRSYGITKAGNELKVLATERTFAQKKNDLLQAMLAIENLIYLARPTVLALFKEDVTRFLDARNVRAIPNLKLTGESGLDHSFDFAIPRSFNRPYRYIRTIPNPNRESIVLMMQAWRDVQNVRDSDSVAYAILNDQEEKRINPDLLGALEKYKIQVMRWSERDSKIEALQD